MSNFIHITPFMHVESLDRALTFFTNILGFEIGFRAATYAYVHRETAFRILEQTGPDGAPRESDGLPTTSTSTTSIASTPN
jgi:catechol 2,3-dioxygenase-like lactoylglutathione lyase family enzyme